MTEVLTVPTHFGDLSELSQGLVDRVGDGSLILYGPAAYERGSTVSFRVLLADDSLGLEGFGRINEVYDGGDAREPETRYDIVFDTLQLDGRNEVVYERIVLARQSMVGDEPATGEVDISEFEEAAPAEVTEFPEEDQTIMAAPAEEVFFDASSDLAEPADVADAADIADVADVADMADAADAAPEEGDFAISFDEPEAAAPVEVFAPPAEEVQDLGDYADIEDVADIADVAMADVADIADVSGGEFVDASEAVFADEAPVAPPSFEAPPAQDAIALSVATGPLGRPTFAASWSPTAPHPEPRPSTGWFLYEAGTLPAPAQPPRPELSPEMRIARAPMPDPNAPVEAAAPPVEAPTEAAVVEEAPVEEFSEPLEAIEAEVAPDPNDVPPDAETPEVPLGEMPLPDEDAEIAPAVEAEYASIEDIAEVAPAELAPAEDVAFDVAEEAIEFDGITPEVAEETFDASIDVAFEEEL